MGKSSNSCFNIIGCGGGDAVDDDDLSPEEAKASSDKRRWSFRKKSSRNQVLSNSVISDPISICSSKQTQDALTSNLHSSKYALPEKPQIKEKPIEESPIPSNIVNTEAPPSLSNRSTTPVSPVINESDVVIIQTAIRGYLARKMLRKLKSVVKLQAAVRGHLVRRQAFGTLRCIQAIIRMQALVRARRAQPVGSITFSEDTKFQGKGDPIEKSGKTSIKKLLSNGLARQLLANTSTPKTMYLKCDPSKSDSAWMWLERWMAVTSSGAGHPSEQNFNLDGWELEGDAEKPETEPTTVLSDMKMASAALVKTNDDKNSVTAENIGEFEFQTSVTSSDNPVKSSLKNDGEDLELENEGLNTRIEDYTDTEMMEDSPVSILDDKALPQHLSSETLVEPEPEKVESAKDSANHGKRNPAFAAAQAKFEELSSIATADQPASIAGQNVTSNSKRESNNLKVDSFTDDNEANPTENLMLHDSRTQAAGSECGTEISISSTLDSLDRSEMEGGEIVLEIGALEKQNYSISSDAEKVVDISDRNGNSDMNEQPQNPDGSEPAVANPNDSIGVVLVDQNPTVPTTSAVENNLEVTTEQARSPEGTPRSHPTVPDPHGTPSSETSVRSKKSKKDHNILTHKQRSHSVGKRSPSNPNNDSGVRSSTEIISNDSRVQKRRNSFGIAKTDHVDQEPRLSSSNSLPGYMQATASARAKAHTSQSQKCSPDLLDNQLKKRHSLPIENGKQSSSPRIQRSASQALQSAKSNGVHSPQNSAERRWQR